jgi:mRNA degradation ribonuclease J1/J2
VGGLLFRRGNDAIMTAPFYSNPNIFRVGLRRPIHSDTNLVERLLPDVSDVRAILVGHAHYDHLMDVPYIANYKFEYPHYGAQVGAFSAFCLPQIFQGRGL